MSPRSGVAGNDCPATSRIGKQCITISASGGYVVCGKPSTPYCKKWFERRSVAQLRPSAVIIDGQPVKTISVSGSEPGFDGSGLLSILPNGMPRSSALVSWYQSHLG
jgi:hypothetical protein